MSHEKFYHKVPKTSRDILRYIQHRIDQSRPKPMVGGFHRDEIPFAGTQEQTTLFFPPEIEEGLVAGFNDFENGIQHDVWLEQVRRTNTIYNQSISVTEDPRLKDD